MKRAPAILVVVGAVAATANATPRENRVFTNTASNGLLNSPANTVVTHPFAGGYALGRIDLSGSLTSAHASTWRSDSRIVITAPGGQSVTVQPFAAGGTFSILPFNASVYLVPGTDPAGTWAFRFYETFDDGGNAAVDARWNFTLTLTDDQPAPPASTDLGTLTAAGAARPADALAAGQVRWYRFTLPAPIVAPLRYFDLDTFGSAVTGLYPNDTVLGLYDASGMLVATDNDSGDGFTAAMSFGAGTRPGRGDGLPNNGRNGPLAAGIYFVAVVGAPSSLGPAYWQVVSTSSDTGTVALNLATNTGGACYANCDGSTIAPVLNVQDFTCFLQRYATGNSYANCDESTTAPALNVQDFTCFLQRYAAGCP
jgi:hypothetical protein